MTAVCSSAIRSHLLVLPSCWYSLNGGIFLELGEKKTLGKDNKGGGVHGHNKVHTYRHQCNIQHGRLRVRVSFLMRTFHNTESYVS